MSPTRPTGEVLRVRGDGDHSGPLHRLVKTPVRAGTAVLNGAGELTGSLQIGEWGTIETPIYLTSTMAVGRIYDGAVTAAIAADPSVGTRTS